MLTGGVQIVDREALGFATVLVRKGKHAELTSRVRERFGIELPRDPRRAVGPDVAFAGISPGGWLAMREHAPADFASSLGDALGGVASVSDQSDATL